MKIGSLHIYKNYSLKELHSFGVKVNTAYFIELNSEAEILEFSQHMDEIPKPIYFLGGGSNSLFTTDFSGTIVHINNKGIELINESDKEVFIEVGAGEVWDEFVDFCVENEYYGVENLKLIPGQVGTAPIQNIGAYGVEAKDTINEVIYLDIEDSELYSLDNGECKFGYRDSIFKHELKSRFIIISVIFRLSKTPNYNLEYGAIKHELKSKGIEKPSIGDLSNIIAHIRFSKLPDPKEIGNAGSFFKNPIVTKEAYEQIKEIHPDIVAYALDNGDQKLAAGWLIDTLGWKSKKHKGAAVHSKQALVLTNLDNATGMDVWELAELIRADVKKHFNIDLEAEVHRVN